MDYLIDDLLQLEPIKFISFFLAVVVVSFGVAVALFLKRDGDKIKKRPVKEWKQAAKLFALFLLVFLSLLSFVFIILFCMSGYWMMG